MPYYCWDPVVPLLVDEGYKVIRYNHYGRGLSARISGHYTLELYKEQLSHEEAGHNSQYEKPRALADTILSFITESSR
ncbi:MAG TPA: hypothetical protein PLU33_06220 [Treponemataceae bacterium]|nr:hypothetical protein [Treponemataceae bacterium]HQL04717.1 hypothetical protein [Treponemataceae bacterium]